MLENYYDIIVDDLPNELPPIRKISHHIHLIPGASLPNKAAYRMTLAENEEVKKQVQELLYIITKDGMEMVTSTDLKVMKSQ